ncbi:MAG: hypothetical protein AB7N76_03380 [Planctomycetota bacterium]
MSTGCHTCGQPSGLAACLYCGRAFCSLHRGDLAGAAACAGCLKEEHARKAALRQKREAREKARARRSGAQDEDEAAAPPPPPPLPEPPRTGPVVWGLRAAVPTAIYLWLFLGWLAPRHELPGWSPPAGAVLGALVAFAGVWAIVKTKQGGAA